MNSLALFLIEIAICLSISLIIIWKSIDAFVSDQIVPNDIKA